MFGCYIEELKTFEIHFQAINEDIYFFSQQNNQTN